LSWVDVTFPAATNFQDIQLGSLYVEEDCVLSGYFQGDNFNRVVMPAEATFVQRLP